MHSKLRITQRSLLPATVALTLAFNLVVVAASEPVIWEFWLPSDETSMRSIDHGEWQYMLDTYLVSDHPSGITRFKYANVTVDDRDRLGRYIDGLAGNDPRQLNRAEQRAYWTNLYNALTVALVVDFYPVGSIREIHGGLFNSGPWDEQLIEVAGQKLSLDDIEHRILRPVFRDPRTHYSINCASIGCPNLAAEAYTRENMERLLNKGARDFINHPRGVEIADEKLKLSSIYKWFSVDFGQNETELITHLRSYALPALAEQLENFDNKIIYEYDWRLNEP